MMCMFHAMYKLFLPRTPSEELDKLRYEFHINQGLNFANK
jgi:hypothetical protein